MDHSLRNYPLRIVSWPPAAYRTDLKNKTKRFVRPVPVPLSYQQSRRNSGPMSLLVKSLADSKIVDRQPSKSSSVAAVDTVVDPVKSQK